MAGLQYDEVVTAQKGKSADELAATAQAATQPNFNSINSTNLTPTTPVVLPSPPPPSGSSDALVASVGSTPKTIQDYITALTPTPTAAESQNQSIVDSIAALTGQDTGKTAYQNQQEQAQGVPELQRQLSDLNGQITTGNAEYQQLVAKENENLANLGGNGTAESKAVLGAQQSGVIRAAEAQKASKAADLALIAARAQAVSGNINTALQIAKNAVDARYQPIEDSIKVKQAQLAALAPILNKEQKIQALAQQKMLDDQAQEIADAKDQEKQIQSVMVEAAKAGASSDVLSAIQGARSVSEAISLAGDSLAQPAKLQLQQQAFENNLKLHQLGIDQARLALDQRKEEFDQAQKAGSSAPPVMQQELAKANIDLVDSLVKDKGLNSAVGPNYLARFSVANQLSGAKSNFVAGVEQLRSQLNLDTLIKAKSNGATFGALSDQELQVLANAATKIGAWAIKKDGQVTGYNASEKDFRTELDKINNFAKLDYLLKGGKPDDIGVQVQSDGTYWVRNADGTLTQL